jgi:hypothetical protein
MISASDLLGLAQELGENIEALNATVRLHDKNGDRLIRDAGAEKAAIVAVPHASGASQIATMPSA